MILTTTIITTTIATIIITIITNAIIEKGGSLRVFFLFSIKFINCKNPFLSLSYMNPLFFNE